MFNPRIVKLENPEMCITCRFASVALVHTKDGNAQTMMHCKRLDCDNWENDPDAPQPEFIEEQNADT